MLPIHYSHLRHIVARQYASEVGLILAADINAHVRANDKLEFTIDGS